MKPLIIDLESGPLSPEALEAIKPKFEAAKNLRDPEKIAASIAEKEQEWKESAALSALTGELLCVGMLQGDEYQIVEGTEPDMLNALWVQVNKTLANGASVVGFCINIFDLPFAVRRSYKHGVVVPRNIRRGRWWSDSIVDIADLWSCGSRESRDRISLDNLARFLGVGSKTGHGASFAELWVIDKPKAIEYLRQDLRLTKLAYERMGQ